MIMTHHHNMKKKLYTTIFAVLVLTAPTFKFLSDSLPAEAKTPKIGKVSNSLTADLRGFRTRTYIIDKGRKLNLGSNDMKHILERHHPKYWSGQSKSTQTFFKDRMSIDDVTNAMESVIKQNMKELKEFKPNKSVSVMNYSR
jgi:hypothetical protein